ncbi:hypothetical protein A3B49_01130 [Candidatus Daviesbacteria bacterium RIFCSPLOWO2_01_FULL_40_24]|uniref:Glycosyltransferase RgtA/B/C/D-like domain-containing protein n=1 Tax=Candidatus Daviesbacteria bacterium RIFCSPLOWO2_01_FULL_40_24 TaxID=1797787 RepID=A0A1F5MJC7_9BACT|nr:MAG: hypothetical protein A3B49_01130 [Candidatus Daviesbacteria bacterium RIFCSPLOWO2_01_FULL_40_24]
MLDRKIFKTVLLLFLSWRIGLFIVLIAAINFLPLGYSDKFLGGGSNNYPLIPEVFAWANFDGEHFLAISIFGYNAKEQAFFPLYPALINILSRPFYGELYNTMFYSTIMGVLISSVCFLVALYFLWKLLRIDFDTSLVNLTVILLLVFPTSFFFAAVYSESLFFLLSILSFYFARINKWYEASLCGMFASATRVFGVLLLPTLLIELYLQKGKFKDGLKLLLIPVGLLLYMIYQWSQTGDPLAFYHLQGTIGEQRQLGIILLPQVFYRYINILFHSDPTNPIYQTVVLEFITGILFLFLPIYGYLKKIRLSYLFYALVGFMLSPLQGSFSSVPRYIIVLFPSFVALAILFNNFPKWSKIVLMSVLVMALIIEASLFFRGYWVA